MRRAAFGPRMVCTSNACGGVIKIILWKKEDEKGHLRPAYGLYAECVWGVIKIILWKKEDEEGPPSAAYEFVRRMRVGVIKIIIL